MRSKVCVITKSGKRVCGRPVSKASGAAAGKYVVTVTQKGSGVMTQHPAMSLPEARGIAKTQARVLGKHLREATVWERDAQGNTKSVFAISRF